MPYQSIDGQIFADKVNADAYQHSSGKSVHFITEEKFKMLKNPVKNKMAVRPAENKANEGKDRIQDPEVAHGIALNINKNYKKTN